VIAQLVNDFLVVHPGFPHHVTLARARAARSRSCHVAVSPWKGPCIWLRGRGLRLCEAKSSVEMPVRSRHSLRSTEAGNSARDGASGGVGLGLDDGGPRVSFSS
jgi:hypothetical protein